ncbi:hypothetical protein LMH87_009398 [Akanthomyces muscarius]|uniref:Uncharacterized protein n=1 Tax=Akanthomyces muscarius TaxID=2231603 RepID=A0A9W8UKZ4_AKAMU|nr:hypothetical protein LMH87_009398 [Akanthomyces muscarius]KAJ4152878.1 hypothetical protein LMH87_009398 [Akanthomyces muscarius]
MYATNRNAPRDAGSGPQTATASLTSPWSRTAARLLVFHEIPTWQQDNNYLLSGYRVTSASVATSVASLLYLNNQTINTYSHLLGLVVFALLPFYFCYCVLPVQSSAQEQDVVVVSIYCYAVAVCFLFSTIFHLLWNHSQNVSRFCNKLDYAGILILMWGAGIPTIYYGFICNPSLQVLYWIMTSSTALCCTIFTLTPSFVTPQFQVAHVACLDGLDGDGQSCRRVHLRCENSRKMVSLHV